MNRIAGDSAQAGKATLVVGVGGFGGLVTRRLAGLLRGGTGPGRTTRICVVDTDANDVGKAEGDGLPAHLVSARGPNRCFGDSRVANVTEHPDRFSGGWVSRFLASHDLLDSLQVEAGASTMPPVGDFLFEISRGPLEDFLLKQVRAVGLDARSVSTILVGSAGGGTSAPGLLRLARAFGGPERHRILGGSTQFSLPDIWYLPPWLQSGAQRTRTFQLRPLANAYAFTKEADYLSHQRVVGSVYRFGLGNGQGAMAGTLEEGADMLADAIHLHLACQGAIEARLADTFRVVSNEPGRLGLRLGPPAAKAPAGGAP